MKYYTVADIEIRDRGWVRDYVENVTPMVERRGGRYLARTGNVVKIEGARPTPQVLLIIEWPSREAANAFYESDEYRPYRDARSSGSKGEFMLVAGEDESRIAAVDR